MSEPKVLAEIDDPKLGRWVLDGESIHKAGWVDVQDDYELVRWDEFDGSGEVRVLAVLLIDAVRRLSERIDVLDREIRRQGKDGMQDHLERKHLAEALRRLSVRVDGIDQAVRDTRVEQGEVNLVTELDTRHAMRRLEELEERVAALEVKPATSPRDDALIQPNDTVSEATWDYIQYQVVDEIVTRLFNRDAAGRDGEAIGSQVPIAAWLQREYLEGEEDGDEG